MGIAEDGPEEFGSVRMISDAADRQHVISDGRRQGGEHTVEGHDETAAGPQAVDKGVDPIRRSRTRIGGRSGQISRTERVEVETVDAAVAPDLVFLRRERR